MNAMRSQAIMKTERSKKCKARKAKRPERDLQYVRTTESAAQHSNSPLISVFIKKQLARAVFWLGSFKSQLKVGFRQKWHPKAGRNSFIWNYIGGFIKQINRH